MVLQFGRGQRLPCESTFLRVSRVAFSYGLVSFSVCAGLVSSAMFGLAFHTCRVSSRARWDIVLHHDESITTVVVDLFVLASSVAAFCVPVLHACAVLMLFSRDSAFLCCVLPLRGEFAITWSVCVFASKHV